MAQQKKTAKKTAKKTTKKAVARAASSRAGALDPSLEWSLEEVAEKLPSIPEAEIERMLQGVVRASSEGQLVALGADYRTEDILATAPSFAIGALLAMEQLRSPLPGLARSLVPLLVREARELGRLNIRYEQERRDVSTSISGRRAQLKAANSAALRQRRSVTQALLRYVVPSDSSVRVELTEAAAGSKSHAETVASTRAVARILEALRQDGALTRLLDDLHYTDATVEELRTLAADVERLSAQGAGLRPPQWTDQPTLDRQDGLVLCLMRAIWDPLREAKLDGAGIALPPVGSLERFFIRTSSPEDESDGDDAGGEIVASDGPPAA